MFEQLFENYKWIDKMGLEYHQKVQLSIACGLDARLEKPLNTIGTMRNKFAHRIDAKLGKNEVDSLYQAFSGDDKQNMQDAYKSAKKQLRFKKASSMSKLDTHDRFTLIAFSLHSAVATETKKVVDEKSA